MGDLPITHLGQDPAAGRAPFQHDSVKIKKKEIKLLSIKGRVITWWFGGFFTATTSRMAFSWEHLKDGAVCTEFVTTQPPSCCSAVNEVLITYFPSPCALNRGRGGFVGADRPLECTSLIPVQQHKPWASSRSLPCSPPFEPPPLWGASLSNFGCTSCAHLACGVPGLPLALCTSEASPACLLFPAPLPGLTRGLTPLSNRMGNISSPQGLAHIL